MKLGNKALGIALCHAAGQDYTIIIMLVNTAFIEKTVYLKNKHIKPSQKTAED